MTFTNHPIEFLHPDRVHDYYGQNKAFERHWAKSGKPTAHSKGYSESHWYGTYAECTQASGDVRGRSKNSGWQRPLLKYLV